MNKLTFIDAVLSAVESVRSSKKTFTISDFLAQLRSDVETGKIEIDKNIQDVTIVDVNTVFQNAINTGKITFLTQGSDDENGATIYFNSNKESQNVSEFPVKDTSGSLEEKIFFYLDAFETGEKITIKMIQSRFKGIHKTCAEYADILESEGYLLDKTSVYPSKWFVEISE